jgi:hypothetical protein
MTGIRPSTVSQTGAGSSNWLPVDVWREPMEISGYVAVTDSATYDVEYTYDDVRNPDVIPEVFIGALTGVSVTQDFFLNGAVNALRVTITAGAGRCDLVVLQDGGRGS